jgi:cytochrome b6-f complex iron-sulfur subunit
MSELQSVQQTNSPQPQETTHATLHQIGRRHLMRLGWMAAGVAFLGSQVWILLKLLFSPTAPDSFGGEIVVGSPERFVVGSVTHFWKERFLLVHRPTGFLALSHECTHSKCYVDFLPERGIIFCPCHGSQFSVTGTVLTGPASRPLARFAVSMRDGQVVVDTSRRQAVAPAL